MFITKFSRLGAHVVKSLRIGAFLDYWTKFGLQSIRNCQTSPFGQFTSIPRMEYSRVFNNHSFRPLSYQPFSTTADNKGLEGGDEKKEKISVMFVDKDGVEKNIKVPIGMSMLEAAHENDIDLEGACEGSVACSTCHVIIMDMEYYNKLEDPTDEENDMLDLAFCLKETSRLGCQVIAEPELDGIRLALPAATQNFVVNGVKPKPH